MAWRDHAACRGRTSIMFDREHVAAAKALCAQCPVCEPCGEMALAFDPDTDRDGVYGGLTAGERNMVRTRTRLTRVRQPGIV